jgi:hypothetical protein
MTPAGLQEELARADRRVGRWRAELVGTLWAAGALAVVWLCGVSDVLLRHGFAGRLALWSLLLLLLAATGVHVWIVLRRKRTTQATAAMLERAFPQLDNHLINYVQFARTKDSSPLLAAYLRRGVPEWRGIRLEEMRDRRTYLRARLALAGGFLLLAAPLLWMSDPWSRALRRVLNPFSNVQPSSTAQIVSVAPGDVSVRQGGELLLSCRVKGLKGEAVEMELEPEHSPATASLLGRLAGVAEEEFTFRIPAVAAPFAYRFRAGNALPSQRYRVQVHAPLAVSSLQLAVRPPAYTALPAAPVDALSAPVAIQEGASVGLRLRCNRALATASVAVAGSAPAPLAGAEQGAEWSGTIQVSSGHVMRVACADAHGESLQTDIRFTLVPDSGPAIRIVQPSGKSALPPGALPRIRFEVADDYGLGSVALERVDRANPDQTRGMVIQEWTPSGTNALEGEWVAQPGEAAEISGFRIVALDNAQPGPPHRAVSSLIVFNAAAPDAAAKMARQINSEAAATLSRLVEMQRANLNLTVQLRVALDAAAAPQWTGAHAAQVAIRRMAIHLLSIPGRPLGAMTEPLVNACRGPMEEVIDVLNRVQTCARDTRARLAEQAVTLETAILRLLTRMQDGMDRVERHRATTGIMSLIEALVKGQKEALDAAEACSRASKQADPALVKRQDGLSADLAELVRLCQQEAMAQEVMDPEFSKTLLKAVALAEEKKIKADMLAAAEHLEGGKAAEALPCQARALAGLRLCSTVGASRTPRRSPRNCSRWSVPPRRT